MKIGDTKRLIIFFIIISLFITLGMSFFGVRLIYRVVKTNNWTSTQGVILDSRVQTSPNGKTLFWPNIRYSYKVNGSAYVSNQFAITDVKSYSPNRAQEIISQLPAGTKVTVYYNPQAPSEAILQKYVFEIWIPLACGLILLVFAVLVLPKLA